MGSAFHQLCPRYNGTLTPTALTAVRIWKTFTIPFYLLGNNLSDQPYAYVCPLKITEPFKTLANLLYQSVYEVL